MTLIKTSPQNMSEQRSLWLNADPSIIDKAHKESQAKSIQVLRLSVVENRGGTAQGGRAGKVSAPPWGGTGCSQGEQVTNRMKRSHCALRIYQRN